MEKALRLLGTVACCLIANQPTCNRSMTWYVSNVSEQNYTDVIDELVGNIDSAESFIASEIEYLSEFRQDKKSQFSSYNPYWSYTCREYSAFLVEFVMFAHKIGDENALPYKTNVIVSKSRKMPPLDQADLRKLKELYLIWWQDHKHLRLEQLRKQWHMGDRALVDTDYSWQ